MSLELRQLLCNARIQPHFDYTCSAWYPNLKKKFKTKLQTLQNKYVCFCLQLDNKAHVGITEFKQINWLPVNYRFRQCLAANVFKFFNDKCPLYMKDVSDKPCIKPSLNKKLYYETKSTIKENQKWSALSFFLGSISLEELAE